MIGFKDGNYLGIDAMYPCVAGPKASLGEIFFNEDKPNVKYKLLRFPHSSIDEMATNKTLISCMSLGCWNDTNDSQKHENYIPHLAKAKRVFIRTTPPLSKVIQGNFNCERIKGLQENVANDRNTDLLYFEP